MAQKEVKIGPAGFDFRPFYLLAGSAVEVVNLGAAHSQNKGRMGGDYKLTAIEACRILNEFGKLNLHFG